MVRTTLMGHIPPPSRTATLECVVDTTDTDQSTNNDNNKTNSKRITSRYLSQIVLSKEEQSNQPMLPEPNPNRELRYQNAENPVTCQPSERFRSKQPQDELPMAKQEQNATLLSTLTIANEPDEHQLQLQHPQLVVRPLQQTMVPASENYSTLSISKEKQPVLNIAGAVINARRNIEVVKLEEGNDANYPAASKVSSKGTDCDIDNESSKATSEKNSESNHSSMTKLLVSTTLSEDTEKLKNMLGSNQRSHSVPRSVPSNDNEEQEDRSSVTKTSTKNKIKNTCPEKPEIKTRIVGKCDTNAPSIASGRSRPPLKKSMSSSSVIQSPSLKEIGHSTVLKPKKAAKVIPSFKNSMDVTTENINRPRPILPLTTSPYTLSKNIGDVNNETEHGCAVPTVPNELVRTKQNNLHNNHINKTKKTVPECKQRIAGPTTPSSSKTVKVIRDGTVPVDTVRDANASACSNSTSQPLLPLTTTWRSLIRSNDLTISSDSCKTMKNNAEQMSTGTPQSFNPSSCRSVSCSSTDHESIKPNSTQNFRDQSDHHRIALTHTTERFGFLVNKNQSTIMAKSGNEESTSKDQQANQALADMMTMEMSLGKSRKLSTKSNANKELPKHGSTLLQKKSIIQLNDVLKKSNVESRNNSAPQLPISGVTSGIQPKVKQQPQRHDTSTRAASEKNANLVKYNGKSNSSDSVLLDKIPSANSAFSRRVLDINQASVVTISTYSNTSVKCNDQTTVKEITELIPNQSALQTRATSLNSKDSNSSSCLMGSLANMSTDTKRPSITRSSSGHVLSSSFPSSRVCDSIDTKNSRAFCDVRSSECRASTPSMETSPSFKPISTRAMQLFYAPSPSTETALPPSKNETNDRRSTPSTAQQNPITGLFSENHVKHGKVVNSFATRQSKQNSQCTNNLPSHDEVKTKGAQSTSSFQRIGKKAWQQTSITLDLKGASPSVEGCHPSTSTSSSLPRLSPISSNASGMEMVLPMTKKSSNGQNYSSHYCNRDKPNPCDKIQPVCNELSSNRIENHKKNYNAEVHESKDRGESKGSMVGKTSAANNYRCNSSILIPLPENRLLSERHAYGKFLGTVSERQCRTIPVEEEISKRDVKSVRLQRTIPLDEPATKSNKQLVLVSSPDEVAPQRNTYGTILSTTSERQNQTLPQREEELQPLNQSKSVRLHRTVGMDDLTKNKQESTSKLQQADLQYILTDLLDVPTDSKNPKKSSIDDLSEPQATVRDWTSSTIIRERRLKNLRRQVTNKKRQQGLSSREAEKNEQKDVLNEHDNENDATSSGNSNPQLHHPSVETNAPACILAHAESNQLRTTTEADEHSPNFRIVTACIQHDHETIHHTNTAIQYVDNSSPTDEAFCSTNDENTVNNDDDIDENQEIEAIEENYSYSGRNSSFGRKKQQPKQTRNYRNTSNLDEGRKSNSNNGTSIDETTMDRTNDDKKPFCDLKNQPYKQEEQKDHRSSAVPNNNPLSSFVKKMFGGGKK